MADAIQTNSEHEGGTHRLSEVSEDRNISVNPFAVLPESAYEKFPDGYFRQFRQKIIKSSGVLIGKAE